MLKATGAATAAQILGTSHNLWEKNVEEKTSQLLDGAQNQMVDTIMRKKAIGRAEAVAEVLSMRRDPLAGHVHRRGRRELPRASFSSMAAARLVAVF